MALYTPLKCVSLKRKGLAKVEHYPAICEEDLHKLYNESSVFCVNIPKNLQWKVFFELLLFFCRRGMENLCDLKKKNGSMNLIKIMVPVPITRKAVSLRDRLQIIANF